MSLEAYLINIANSSFYAMKGSACTGEGCIMNMKGYLVGSNNLKQVRQVIAPHAHRCIALIENSDFVGPTAGGTIKTKYFHLTLINCRFTLGESSKVSLTSSVIFVNSFWSFNATNVTFDATGQQNSETVISIMSIKSKGVHLENVYIKCPSTWNPVEKLPREVSVDLLDLDLYYSCNRACVDETYTFEAGSMILDGDLSSKQLESLKQNYVLPTCQRCPIGVKCEGKIQIMPNYWGYMVENDTVYTVRCPDGYCCQEMQHVRELILVTQTGLELFVVSVCRTGLNLYSQLHAYLQKLVIQIW